MRSKVAREPITLCKSVFAERQRRESRLLLLSSRVERVESNLCELSDGNLGQTLSLLF